MAAVFEIRDLLVRRGKRPVLQVSHLDIFEKETLAVIGPNGAGKSTLLLVLSRLIKVEAGQVFFRGKAVGSSGDLSYRRKIGLVLQDPLLLDMSVFDNVAAGLRFRGLPSRQVEPRVKLWLERLGIAGLAGRRARSLSGGEAQRVSLARALALDPDVLLLDEPFSALDAPSRAHLLDDFHALIRSVAITTVFVTHDLDEALQLGDRVAVVLDGHLAQVGPPVEVFNAPADPEIARFVGVETVIEGRVLACQAGMTVVEAGSLKFEAVGEIAAGRPVYLCLRPEDITLWAQPIEQASSARNKVTGRLVRLIPQGPLMRVVLDCGPMGPLVALITRSSASELGLQTGQQVSASFKASAVHLIAS
jgi:tungstate transport system ATP-binding protein